MLPLPLLSLLLANLVVLAGAMVQGSVGLGLGLVAAPILIQMDPGLVPGPLMMAALALTILVLIRERSGVDFHGLRWAIGGRIVTVWLGALALSAMPLQTMQITFGILLLLAVAMVASGLHVRPTRGALLGAGAISGFMGTITAVGGPPVALVYQAESGTRLRGTLAGYFLVGVSLSLVALWSVGRFGAPEVTRGACILPGIVVGFLLSSHGARRLDQGHTRAAVLIVSGAAACTVIARGLL